MKLINKLFLFSILAFLLSVIPVFIFPDNIDVRSKFYQIIFEGYLSVFLFLTLLIFLIIFGLKDIRKNKWLEGVILIFFPIVLIISVGYLFLLFKGNDFGTFNKDLIVYQNTHNKELIIIQHLEENFDGIPQYRILKTSNDLNSGLRKFEKINLKEYDLINSINFSALTVNCHSIPKTLEYAQNNYKLKYCAKE
ncbi:hypothetical protein FEDK69T_30730 [Flavobacterium enshiense DK69]|uniref:Uncharacterized protein n=1 Tax=Flavobacterium enshiense DK69 TaxID=1107311 RepID=V6S0M3_9FLAO|nr:hypothetical protein [Flavobacterium enshiense]ESU19817.1 hypothetical protein FEDK69T_30730 [Flavobacterium enshiense DK69]KGO93116.1 hypothetical protein Q767_15160 [Flavobacterium enshiense DK69]